MKRLSNIKNELVSLLTNWDDSYQDHIDVVRALLDIVEYLEDKENPS